MQIVKTKILRQNTYEYEKNNKFFKVKNSPLELVKDFIELKGRKLKQEIKN